MGPLLLPLLVVANVLGVGMIVPQALRLHRTRLADGVSAIWVGSSLTVNLWWLAYGLQTQLWGLVPVSSGALIVYGIIATQLRLLGGPPTTLPLIASIGAISLALLLVLTAAGWPTVGLTLGMAYGLQFAPAVIEVFRPGPTTGVSAATWAMAATEAAIWIVYGLAVVDLALILGGVGGTVMAVAILARLASANRYQFTPLPTTWPGVDHPSLNGQRQIS